MLKRKSYDNRNDGAVGRRAEIRPWSRLKRKTYDNRDIAFPQMYKVPAFFSDSPLVTDTGSISDLAKETLTSLLNMLKAQGMRVYMTVTGRGMRELYGPR